MDADSIESSISRLPHVGRRLDGFLVLGRVSSRAAGRGCSLGDGATSGRGRGAVSDPEDGSRDAFEDCCEARRSKRRRPTHLATQQRTTFLAKRAVVWSPTGWDGLLISNVKIAWENLGLRVKWGHIYQVTGCGPCPPGTQRNFISLCAGSGESMRCADLTPSCDVTGLSTRTPNQGNAWWIITKSSSR